MAIWSAPMAVVGGVIGAVLHFGWNGEFVDVETIFGGIVATCTAYGGIFGASNGGAFAIAVLATQRRRRMHELRYWHFIALGAVVTAIPAFAVQLPFIIVGVSTAAGAAVGALSLSLARHGEAIAAGDEPTPLPPSGAA